MSLSSTSTFPASISDQPSRRIVIGITGATGAIYGVRLLTILRDMPDIETHLVISDAGALNLHQELDINRKQVEALSDAVYSTREIGAAIASGSFQSDGMIIAPCSMKTLSSISSSLCDNLITRAADVVLKEHRRLLLMVRETPFNLAHLRNMISITEMGGIVFPPLPSFYHRPKNITEMVDHTLGRVLDLLMIDNDIVPRWSGLKKSLNKK